MASITPVRRSNTSPIRVLVISFLAASFAPESIPPIDSLIPLMTMKRTAPMAAIAASQRIICQKRLTVEVKPAVMEHS